MEKVKSALEKAMEKIQAVEGLSSSEKEALRKKEQIAGVLADFFRGDLSGGQLRDRLKGMEAEYLRDAQARLAGSLRIGNSRDEMDRKREGIIAIETLKTVQNLPAIEDLLAAMERIQQEAMDIRQQASEELRRAVEENPHLRARPVRTPDGRTVMQASLSVDEAVQKKMAEFLAGHEKKYAAMFDNALQHLLRELK